VKVEVVKGIYGHVALYFCEDDDSGLRVAGQKPWGGGQTIYSFDVDLADKRTRTLLLEALEREKPSEGEKA
jgi:hypothetical protein